MFAVTTHENSFGVTDLWKTHSTPADNSEEGDACRGPIMLAPAAARQLGALGGVCVASNGFHQESPLRLAFRRVMTEIALSAQQ